MKALRAAALLSILALAACGSDDADNRAPADVPMWQGELPIRDPWLRDHLADDALAYFRIPNILGMLATPKGNALDPALRSEVHVENLQKIQQGIVDNILSAIPASLDAGIGPAFEYVISPVEISARFLPAPSGLIAATLSINSEAALVEMLAGLSFSLVEPLDADGVGELIGAGLPTFLRFEADSGRILLFVGPGASDARFREELGKLDRTTPHHMRRLEARVDESGQGWFYWIDAVNARPALQMTVQPGQLQTLNELGFEYVDAVAMGWGVANGKGRLAIVADMPADGDRGFVPNISNDLSASSAGEPDALMLFSIPTAEEFTRLEGLALDLADTEDQAEWAEVKTAVTEMTGVSIDDIFSVLGPEMLMILDQAGDYYAVRLRDRALWDRMVDAMAEKLDSRPDTHVRDGQTYYHWSMPSDLAMISEDEALSTFGPFLEIVTRPREHYYWIVDGDFIYFAAVPQVLYDRVAWSERVNIGDWLDDTQRIEADSALFSFSGRSRKIPRRLYSLYIYGLQLLAEAADADIDVWSMPSSTELGLPVDGTMGFTLSLGNPTLAAEFTFENNPLEVFGGMGTAAVAGVLAAIAIPAYEDYVVRAEISEGLNLSAPVKSSLAEFHATNGRFPNGDEVAQFEITGASDNVSWIFVDPDSGVIVVQYYQEVAEGGEIWFEPAILEGGRITWSCAGSFEDKYLPAACR